MVLVKMVIMKILKMGNMVGKVGRHLILQVSHYFHFSHIWGIPIFERELFYVI